MTGVIDLMIGHEYTVETDSHAISLEAIALRTLKASLGGQCVCFIQRPQLLGSDGYFSFVRSFLNLGLDIYCHDWCY